MEKITMSNEKRKIFTLILTKSNYKCIIKSQSEY
nr:MAG TPA: hypothetical protein [Caudoviricetes sp.]